jgi:NADH-quinone oxidoreductase subunit G
LDAVVIGGVDPLDISAQALNQLLTSFVVSLEISHSAVTAIADVVLPVAAVIEKSGSFLDWQGHERQFEKGIEDAQMRSDLRILSMIADEMNAPINLPSVAATAREIESLGSWDGVGVAFARRQSAEQVLPAADSENMVLVSWRLLLDLGTLQSGEANLAGTAKEARAHISASKAQQLGVSESDSVQISTERGSIILPVSIRAIADHLIWVPRNSENSQTIAQLGFAGGSVTVSKAS